METIAYLPIAGTDAKDDPWVVDGLSPHTRFMRARGFEPIRNGYGEPWEWSTALNGLWWTGKAIWREDARRLHTFLSNIPYEHRNVIAHSHGGQLAIMACASGLKIRTLTTLGTPVRNDVGVEAAHKNIGFWQHVYDVDRDWMQTVQRAPERLGQLADWRVSTERRFLLPGVQNHGMVGISHSRLVRDETAFHEWDDKSLLSLIRDPIPFAR